MEEKSLKVVKENEVVRIKKYSPTSINSHARVVAIEPHRALLKNLNMPFQGTINRWYSRREFEELTGKTF